MRAATVRLTLSLVLIVVSAHASAHTSQIHLEVSPSRQQRQQDGKHAAAEVPEVLRHLYICIAFHWDVLQLIYLRQVVQAIEAYPTKVELCISSNHPDRLHKTMQLQRWGDPGSVCGWESPLAHPYDLTHVHRVQMVAAAARSPAYSAFLYLEADMLVSWEALLSWAADDALLAPLGLQRGFYRVEVDPRNGLSGLSDQIAPFNISAWQETVTFPPAPEAGIHEERRFVRLPKPYCAVWIASRARLHSFSLSPKWGWKDFPWEVREMGASGVQFIDVPEGFWSAALVPYSWGAEGPALDRVAEIQHLSNRYCARNMVAERSPTETDILLLACTLDYEEFMIM